MKKFKNHTLKEYINILSQKTPVPGGGSAAALTAALGVSLILMVVNYSKGRKQSKRVEEGLTRLIKKSQKIQKKLVDLIDLDAQAYLKVRSVRPGQLQKKKAALKAATRVPLQVATLCYEAIAATPFLVKYGNKNLASDIEVAAELLLAAFNSAMVNVQVNKRG